MAAATARPGPMRSFSLTREDQSSSSSKLRNTPSNTSSNKSSEESGSNNGILCNAHEAPARNGKMNGKIGSKLKAAFTHNQPGKQIKQKSSPIGKTFHREQPLQSCHAGGEVLKVDPRGPDANVGDGVVLSPNGKEDDEEEQGDEFETPTSPGAMSSSNDGTYSECESNDYLSPPFSNQSNNRRSRSNTASTEVSESGSSVCKIKFAPLPTSGRLKRANSITIGVAARSQLLQSQGAGRQPGAGGANTATAWQQILQQQQQQQHHHQQFNNNSQNPTYYQSNNPSRYSGIQPIQEQESQESSESGEGLLKGASKAWNRIRRGSSVSNSSSNGNANAANKPKIAENGVPEEAIDEGDKSAAAINDGGENTPKRAQSPTHYHHGDENEPDGARTPKREMPRRVSTGAFTGHQSFLQIEERRKRGEVEEENQKSSSKKNYKDDERQNDATRFIEMLGRTGQGNEAFHHSENVQIKRFENDKYNSSDFSESGSEQSQSGMSQSGEDDEDDDEEETLEAQRLADQALKGHSEKAIKAGGVEKMEKRRPSLGFMQKK